jgi:hypothetical protein
MTTIVTDPRRSRRLRMDSVLEVIPGVGGVIWEAAGSEF